jgi:hypothetical protein
LSKKLSWEKLWQSSAFQLEKNKPRGDTAASFVAAVEENCPQAVDGLASALGQSKDTITKFLFEDQGLVKKCAHYMSKLIVEDLKKDRMDKDNCSYGPKYWVSWTELLVLFHAYKKQTMAMVFLIHRVKYTPTKSPRGP